MTVAVGTLGRLGIGPATPVTQQLDFLHEDLRLEEVFLGTGGLRGTRAHSVERVRQATRRVVGGIVMHPTPVEMSAMLQWILGGAPTGSGTGASPYVYGLTEGLISQYVTIDRNIPNKIFTYSSVFVRRAVFRSEQGQPLEVSLDLLGVDETVGTTFPALVLDTTTNCLCTFDLALTANGQSYSPRGVTVTLDHHLDDSRFLNSQTLTAINPLDRTVECAVTLPSPDGMALYGLGAAGFAVDLKWSNGTTSLELNLPNVSVPRRSPTVPGREEVWMELPGVARKSGTGTLEMTATLRTTT